MKGKAMRSLAGICVTLSVLLAGCAGLDVRPISQERALRAHEGSSDERGYIVYEPVVVVEVGPRQVCTATEGKGKCTLQTQCAAGAPFILPDYSRPYLVSTKSGLGKAGLDMTIVDGWRLGSLKDSSDNGAVLGILEKLATRGPSADPSAGTEGRCKAAGLYRVVTEQGSVTLSPMLIY
jgi:hypothetical protein